MNLNKQTVYVKTKKEDCDYYMDDMGDLVPLKELPLRHVLTPEELLQLMKKIAGEAFDTGHSLGVAETLFNYTDHISKESLNMVSDKETYINSLSI